ncbi:MAG TPA: glycosyltransferase family 2 protein [Blastocatellia bacterium]|nr:glycosyltransferase family 2 protein [Blastocatellia bacterium]
MFRDVVEARSGRADSLTLLVLTCNEESNLAVCLDSVEGWAAAIVVVDSGSTDRTVEIAAAHGAIIVSHRFDTHARQWNWALANAPLSTEWILALDADQRVTPELREEISRAISEASEGISGFYVRRRQIFRGQWIKHGGYYPKYLLKLFRRGEAWADESDLVDHHFRVKGNVGRLSNDIVEDNRNESDVTAWIEKHNRYASLQAIEEFRTALARRSAAPCTLQRGSPDQRVAMLKRLWSRLPLYFRPFAYFFYRYFLRFGFLDGKEGLVFHFLQGLWYRLLVDIKLDELRRAQIPIMDPFAEDTAQLLNPAGRSRR